MILNVFSITSIFIGVISAILMAWGGINSFLLYRRLGKAMTLEERVKVENRSYLVLMIVLVTLVIRLFDWPLFYATLWSFVSDIDGAMCIFGVTQVRRIFTGLMEVLKPLTFWVIGLWLLLHMLDRSTKTSALMRRKLLLLSVVSVIVFLDSSGGVLLLSQIQPGASVSCCTTVTDILNRPTRTAPEALLGQKYATYLLMSYFGFQVLLMALLAFVIWGKKLKDASSKGSGWWLGGAFILAVVTIAIFLLAQIETIGPAIMHLPYHHCLYCLWQYVPDSILIFVFFALGTYSTGWAFAVYKLGRVKEAVDVLPLYLERICLFGLICLGCSLTMVAIHLIAG